MLDSALECAVSKDLSSRRLSAVPRFFVGAFDRMTNHPRAATVGQLKETGYRPCSVKDELRRNVIKKLKAGEELFPGIVGYRDSVLPQIINGILSKHDMLFLGLRGQAKTRILR